MLKCCSLYSGSTGNSLFLSSENTKVLIDAGASGKKIIEGLESIGVSINEIDSILVTHEHTDHTKSLNLLSNKYDIPIYSTIKTWTELEKQNIKVATKNHKTFNISEKFEIGDLTIFPFKTPHDAIDSCGFSFEADNKKVTIATDLGHVNEEIYSYLQQSDFVLLEANYEPNLLKMGKYPDFLKRRIAGQFGHLSNSDASNIICKLVKNGLSKLMLGHISKENNFPELVYQTVMQELQNLDVDCKIDLDIAVANRTCPSKLICI